MSHALIGYEQIEIVKKIFYGKEVKSFHVSLAVNVQR
jgi:hypothetical protein